MSAELDKARLAMQHAKEIDETHERTDQGLFARRIEVEFSEALKFASINAAIAQAAALEQIVDLLRG